MDTAIKEDLRENMREKALMEKRCYTVEDAAGILNVRKGAVYKLIRENQFETFQFCPRGKIMISKKSFDEWLEKLFQSGLQAT